MIHCCARADFTRSFIIHSFSDRERVLCNSSALLNYYTLRDAQKLHFMQFRAAGLGFSRILRENTSRDSGRLNCYSWRN